MGRTEGFVQWLQDKGLGKASIRMYSLRVREFLTYAEHNSLDLLECRKDHITDFIASIDSLQKRNQSSSALRNFFQWMMENGTYVRDNPASETTQPYARFTRVKWLADDELEILVSKLQNITLDEQWIRIRAKLVVLLALEAGARTHEILDLNLDDDLGKELRVGGDESRLVPVTAMLRNGLDQWKSIRSTLQPVTERLIISRNGVACDASRINRTLLDFKQECNITELTPLILRHTYGRCSAKRMYAAGMELKVAERILMDQMGIEDVRAVRVYLRGL